MIASVINVMGQLHRNLCYVINGRNSCPIGCKISRCAALLASQKVQNVESISRLLHCKQIFVCSNSRD
ncbi:hypothetical protein L3X38_028330 [Prunus dulcis]|uniref:Uncharacterized protein n=1 Tax=Prunus dulcis TaxID=3755 RepID=A0AAD4VQX0_PRUDU|nr:hypothetical protein L3X38_028330 [Prunus dulcis]